MSKIAIMVSYKKQNDETAYKCYALSKYLKNIGNDVYFINYNELEKPVEALIDRLRNKRYFLKKIADIVLNRKGQNDTKYETEKKMYISHFVNGVFKITDEFETETELGSLNNQFDFFVTMGSDIWDSNSYDSKFYLDFVKNDYKKIAYITDLQFDTIDKNKMIDNIRHFKKIFTDSEKVYKYMRNKNYNIDFIENPLLYLTKEDWTISNEDNKKEYVALYLQNVNKRKLNSIIKDINKLDLDVKIISDFNKENNDLYNHTTSNKLITTIINSCFVITDIKYIYQLAYSVSIPSFSIIDNHNDKKNIYYYSYQFFEHDYQNNGKGIDLQNIKNNQSINEEMSLSSISKRINDSKEIITKTLSSKKEQIMEKDKLCLTCSGCGVCSKICPTNCIDVILNKNGFYETKINEKKCINCGLCFKVCGFNSTLTKINDKQVFIGRILDTNSLYKSSSGGFSHYASKYLLSQGYKILGVQYNYNQNIAEHILIDNDDQLINIQGSKYLQSNTKEILKNIDSINKGVVFGTPCQIASINNYLNIKKRRNDFILIDLICHGVPSYNLWNKYIDYIKEENGIKNINNISFRYKDINQNNNHNMNLRILGDNKEYCKHEDEDLFYHFFKVGCAYNNSCYECNYRVKSLADIRIGDYWGEKFIKQHGTSMIIAISDRGKNLINEFEKGKFIIECGDFNDYVTNQQTKNVLKPIYYNELMHDLQDEKISLKKLDTKYCKKFFCFSKLKRKLRR